MGYIYLISLGHVSILYLDSNYFKVKNIIHLSPGEQFKTYSTSHSVFMSFVKFHNHMLSLRIIYSYLVTDLCMVRETYNLYVTRILGTRLSQATTLIENMVAHIAQTTCVRWRLKTADDAYFVKITGDQNG